MTAKVVSITGSTDGIRFGEVQFASTKSRGWFRRRFHWDRLNGLVQLWDMRRVVQDDDPKRCSAALTALVDREGELR